MAKTLLLLPQLQHNNIEISAKKVIPQGRLNKNTNYGIYTVVAVKYKLCALIFYKVYYV